MHKLLKNIFALLLFCIAQIQAFADTITSTINNINNTIVARPETKVEMADLMYQNGKIYVVVLVLLTIFAGIIIFLIRLDNKISKLEKSKL